MRIEVRTKGMNPEYVVGIMTMSELAEWAIEILEDSYTFKKVKNEVRIKKVTK